MKEVSGGGTPARRCRLRWQLVGLAALAGCATPAVPPALHVAHAPPPSAEERYCAWYGDAKDGVLYMGLAPFWSAMRAAGDDPTADLATPGPQWIGRFDLATERWLPPLDVGSPDARSGVWDVHADAAGGLFFTTFYETGGRVDLASGATRRFAEAGGGLNEIAPGPDGGVVISRYGSGRAGDRDGALAVLSREGEIRRELPLAGPAGLDVAPKTPAWDPARGLLWATTDLFTPDGGVSPRHDHFEVAWESGEAVSREGPELQFVSFDDAGRGWLAELEASGELWLRILEPGDAPDGGRRLQLDPAFPASVDFVQDVKHSGGDVVLTRWSGVVHRVAPSGDVRTTRLPTLDPPGLYYTAVTHGDRLCATHCGDVSVVCIDAP